MTDTNPDFEKAASAAAAALTPETFNFLDAVNDRDFPEFEVPVYLNEKSIQKMLTLQKERAALELRVAAATAVANQPDQFMDESDEDYEARTENVKPINQKQIEELEYLDLQYEELVDSLKAERYVVKVVGITPERSTEIEDESYEQYPREYEEVPHPLTQQPMKVEKPSPAREELFATLLRREYIQSVTAPNGAVDNDFEDIEKVRQMIGRLPFVARAKVDQAINEATISVDFYDELASEVF